MEEKRGEQYYAEILDAYSEIIDKLSEKFPRNFHLIGDPKKPLDQFGILDIPLDTNTKRLASSRFDFLYLIMTPNGPRALYTSKRSYLPKINISIRDEKTFYQNHGIPFKPGYFVEDGVEILRINQVLSNVQLKEKGQEDKSGIFFTQIEKNLISIILDNAEETLNQIDLENSYAILDVLDGHHSV